MNVSIKKLCSRCQKLVRKADALWARKKRIKIKAEIKKMFNQTRQ